MFALTTMKTEERHFAEACAEQFLTVARKWEIEGKVTTIGTDSARNMIAAARLLPFEHMPCIAHILQRSITVSLSDRGFVIDLGAEEAFARFISSCTSFHLGGLSSH